MTWSWFCDPTLLLHGFRPSEAVLSKQPLVLNTVKAGRITTQSAEFSWTSNLELHIFEQVHSYKSGVWKELIERFSSWLLGSSHNGFRPLEEAPSDSNLETSGGCREATDWKALRKGRSWKRMCVFSGTLGVRTCRSLPCEKCTQRWVQGFQSLKSLNGLKSLNSSLCFFGESVEHIGDGAFENCMSLETLEFREHVEFCQWRT